MVSADMIKRKPKKLALKLQRRNTARDFMDAFIFPEYAMRELLNSAEKLDELHARIDAGEIDDLADGARHIQTRYKLGEFARGIMRIESANAESFDIMHGAAGILADNISADFAGPLLSHMAATFQIPEMFIENTAAQAQIIAAFGNIPPKWRAMTPAAKAENKCWREFADMVCRTIGGPSQPTLDGILRTMNDMSAADAIGQIVCYHADLDRARTEIMMQSHRYILRTASRMKESAAWAHKFIGDLRGTMQDFENMRAAGVYDLERGLVEYDDGLADKITGTCRRAQTEPPRGPKIYQFPVDAAAMERMKNGR